MTTEDETNGLAGSFVDDTVLLSRDKLEKMANAWMFVDDDTLVVDSTINSGLGLDGEGNGNGASAG